MQQKASGCEEVESGEGGKCFETKDLKVPKQGSAKKCNKIAETCLRILIYTDSHTT